MRNVNIKYLIIIFLVLFDCFFSQLLLPILGDNSLSMFLIFINTIIIGILLLKDKRDRNLKIIIFVGYFLRIFLLLFDTFGRDIFVLPNSGLDSEVFYRLSLNNSFANLNGYTLWLKGLIFFFGDQRIFIQFSNVIFYLLSSLVLVRIFKLLKLSKKASYFGMLLFTLLPSSAIIFSILLREPFMIFLNMASFYFFLLWFENRKNSNFVLSIFLCLCSAYFHSSIIFLILIYVFVLIFYNPKSKTITFTRKSVVLTLISVAGLFFLYKIFGSFVLNYFSGLSSIQDLNEKMQWYTDGGSTYLAFTANVTSIFQIVLYSPLKLLYFYFSPMIWDFRGLNDFLVFAFSSIFYIYIFVLSYRHRKQSTLQTILFYIILALGLVHGMSCFSTGAAMRHREKILPFFVISYAIVCNYKILSKEKEKEEGEL